MSMRNIPGLIQISELHSFQLKVSVMNYLCCNFFFQKYFYSKKKKFHSKRICRNAGMNFDRFNSPRIVHCMI